MQETNLKDSLKSISVGSNEDKVKVRTVMNDCKFRNINVVEESDTD